MPMIHVDYFTDPLCPWSWAAEPTLRRLQVEFSDPLGRQAPVHNSSEEDQLDIPAFLRRQAK